MTNIEEDYFTAIFYLKNNSFIDVPKIHFFKSTGREPGFIIRTKSFFILLSAGEKVKIHIDEIKKIHIILFGEIFNEHPGDQNSYLISLYIKYGKCFPKYLDGSFSIILIDELKDRILICTDIVNTYKIFHYISGNFIMISNFLLDFFRLQKKLNYTAISCYLANGAIYHNNTLLDGIDIIERANIYLLNRAGLKKEKYWDPYDAEKTIYKNTSELKHYLSNRLIESLKKRLPDKPKIFLGLTGGYDSTTILGILKFKLNINKINCFTYALGKPGIKSDEYVAAQMAKEIGVDHKIIKSYNGDITNVILTNAILGNGLANFCDEIDAWMNIKEDFDSKSILLVGDGAFGWISKRDLNSKNDILKDLRIRDLSDYMWLSKIFGVNKFNNLNSDLKESNIGLINRCPGKDYYEIRDFLKLDQRICHLILPWRQFFINRFVTVRYPFLDKKVLEFMFSLNSSLRIERTLYKETVREMFPVLFRFERSRTSSYKADWGKELIWSKKNLIKSFLTNESILDEFICPDRILLLIKKIGYYHYLIDQTGHLFSKIIDKSARKIKKLKSNEFNFQNYNFNNLEKILLRILILRIFLSKNNQ